MKKLLPIGFAALSVLSGSAMPKRSFIAHSSSQDRLASSGPARVISRGIGGRFHVSDYRPATFINMHMLHSDQLRTAAPEAPQNLDLGCVGA